MRHLYNFKKSTIQEQEKIVQRQNGKSGMDLLPDT